MYYLFLILTCFLNGICFAKKSEAAKNIYIVINAPKIELQGVKNIETTLENRIQRKELPKNWRTTLDPVDGKSIKSKRQLDIKRINFSGLTDLRISGSGEFSTSQFSYLQEVLQRNHVTPESLTVLDLRQESHMLINGMAVSWYFGNNELNRNKKLDQILKSEDSLLTSLKGKKITVTQFLEKDVPDKENTHGRPSLWPKIQTEININNVETESALVNRLKSKYVRLNVPDHQKPDDINVDQFINFVKIFWKQQPNQWIHFHCAAGKGRTTTFMVMYDMMKNYHQKGITAEDFVDRHYLLGGSDLFSSAGNTPTRKSWSIDRKNFISRFLSYCKEQGPQGFTKSWTQWNSIRA